MIQLGECMFGEWWSITWEIAQEFRNHHIDIPMSRQVKKVLCAIPHGDGTITSLKFLMKDEMDLMYDRVR